jgi:hypothetical protein
MPTYYAGWVRGNATVWFGLGFTVARQGLVGSYRITLPPNPTNRFFATVVTPVAANRIARVVQFQRNAADGTSLIDVEIRDLTTGQPVDCDFNFMALERS